MRVAGYSLLALLIQALALGGGHGVRYPGRLLPPVGGARRLGLASTVAAAPPADPGRAVPLRSPPFIDHLVAGGGAEAMLVEGSFREVSRQEPDPDHCAIRVNVSRDRPMT